MPIRNLHWYGANTTRAYPLADSATALSTAGLRLPGHILADLNLRYPEALGRYPYLAALTVSAKLVCLTIQGAWDPDDSTTLFPIAAVSLVKPVIPGKPYALEAQSPGVGGWVVFGEGIDEPWTGRFAGPRAAGLAPRAARAYRPLPVESLGRIHTRTALQGVVDLRALAPLYVRAGEREIGGVNRNVILIGLQQPAGQAENIFQQYAGPCAGRPESYTCGQPTPIEFLNGVQPDCDGVITVQFTGCAVLGVLPGGHGVVVDCALDLSEVCTQDRLPDAQGKLRTEYADECASESLIRVSESTSPLPASQSVSASASDSTSESVVGTLPYLETFDTGAAADFRTFPAGADNWNFAIDDSPDETGGVPGIRLAYSTETAAGAAARNLAVWQGFDDWSLRRRYTTAVKIVDGPPGAKHNAGLVVNFRPDLTDSSRDNYYLLELDLDNAEQALRLRRWTGAGFVTLGTVALYNLAVNRWYKLTVTTQPHSGGVVILTASLANIGGPTVSATIGPVGVTRYLPSTGHPGLFADHAFARFSYFKVEAI